MPTTKTFPYSLASIVILMYILIRAAFFLANWEKSFILTWDIFGYYLYLPGLFIYNDLGELSFVSEIMSTYYNNGAFYYAASLPEGGMVLKYPAGMALLYSPFFFIGHLGAHILGYPADGFSMPYQFSIAMGSILFVGWGLWLLRNVLKKYFEDKIVAASLLMLVLGTNLFNYTAFDGPMPHAWLFTLFALTVYLTEKWHKQPQKWTAACIGLVIGVVTISRPINILIALVPLLWGISNKESLKAKFQLILANKLQLVLLIGCVVAVVMIQLIYWKIYSGSFFFYSYEEQGFSFDDPHVTDGLFSYRKGWLIYTPIMILSLIGFWALYHKIKALFVPVLVITILHGYTIFSWDVWWYGGAFGMRPMIDIYALLAFPIAALLERVWKKKYLGIATFVFAFLCVDANLMMTWQAHAPGGGMYTETMTGTYFWKIFGSTHAKKADRVYIDVKKELKDLDRYELETIFNLDMEQDSLPGTNRNHTKNGNQSFLIDHKVSQTPAFEVNLVDLDAKKKDWIRVSAWVFFEQEYSNPWNQAQLVSKIYTHDRRLFQEAPRLHWLSDPWRWHFVEYEFRLEEKHLKPQAKLAVYAWRGKAEAPIWIDDLQVDIIRKK